MMTEILIGFGFGLVVAFAVNAWWMNNLRALKRLHDKSIVEVHGHGRSGRGIDGNLLPAPPFTQRERLGR